MQRFFLTLFSLLLSAASAWAVPINLRDQDFTLPFNADFVTTLNTFTAPRTLTLPPTGSFTGSAIQLIDTNGSISQTNTLTLAPQGSDLINGAASFIVANTGSMVYLVVSPTGWRAVPSSGTQSNSILNILPQTSPTTDYRAAINGVLATGGVAYLQKTKYPYYLSDTLTAGVSGGSIICDPGQAISIATPSNHTPLVINSPLITIKNCTWQYAFGSTPSGLFANLSSDHLLWENNRVIGAGGFFINTAAAWGNRFVGGLYSGAITTAFTVQNGAYQNTFDNLECENNIGFCFFFTLGAHNNRALASWSLANGIELVGITYDSFANTIALNDTALNGDNGYSISGSNNIVSGNHAYHVRYTGLDVYGNSNVVTGNMSIGSGQAHNPTSPYYDAANIVQYSGFSISPNFGGFGANNVTNDNFLDDDQVTPTQAFGWNLSAGYTQWQTATVYGTSNYVYNAGVSYKANSPGGTSGGSPPTCQPSGAVPPNVTCSDGGVTWTAISVSPLNTKEPSNNNVKGNHVFRYLTAGYVDHTINNNNALDTEAGFQYYGSAAGAITNTVTSGFQRKIGTNWAPSIVVAYGDMVYTNAGNILYRVTNAGGTTGGSQPMCTSGNCTTGDGIQWTVLTAGASYLIEQVNQQNSGPNNYLLIPSIDDPTVFVKFFVGVGSPNNKVTAGPGSAYLNTNGGAGTTFCVKQTGTGTTGWSC